MENQTTTKTPYVNLLILLVMCVVSLIYIPCSFMSPAHRCDLNKVRPLDQVSTSIWQICFWSSLISVHNQWDDVYLVWRCLWIVRTHKWFDGASCVRCLPKWRRRTSKCKHLKSTTDMAELLARLSWRGHSFNVTRPYRMWSIRLPSLSANYHLRPITIQLRHLTDTFHLFSGSRSTPTHRMQSDKTSMASHTPHSQIICANSEYQECPLTAPKDKRRTRHFWSMSIQRVWCGVEHMFLDPTQSFVYDIINGCAPHNKLFTTHRSRV